MSNGFGWGAFFALIIGAALAGGGQLITDWLKERRSRTAYITAIKTETSSLCTLIRTQLLEESLIYIIEQCENGQLPENRPTFDFNSNYFFCFESLGSDIRFLKESECRSVVQFYMLIKAGFDTVRRDGPLSRYSDVGSLAQACRFVLSVIRQCFALNLQIEKFSNRSWFAQKK